MVGSDPGDGIDPAQKLGSPFDVQVASMRNAVFHEKRGIVSPSRTNGGSGSTGTCHAGYPVAEAGGWMTRIVSNPSSRW